MSENGDQGRDGQGVGSQGLGNVSLLLRQALRVIFIYLFIYFPEGYF